MKSKVQSPKSKVGWSRVGEIGSLSSSIPSDVSITRTRTRTRRKQTSGCGGYQLIELMVYISVLFLVLGAGYLAVDRCVDSSIVLRRSADDLTSALHAGERWRADVRAANKQIRLESSGAGQVLQLEGARGQVTYRFAQGILSRRVGSAPWTTVLANVASSSMQSDPRQNVPAWRWELELKPRSKASAKADHMRPLFTFVAAQTTNSNK